MNKVYFYDDKYKIHALTPIDQQGIFYVFENGLRFPIVNTYESYADCVSAVFKLIDDCIDGHQKALEEYQDFRIALQYAIIERLESRKDV